MCTLLGHGSFSSLTPSTLYMVLYLSIDPVVKMFLSKTLSLKCDRWIVPALLAKFFVTECTPCIYKCMCYLKSDISPVKKKGEFAKNRENYDWIQIISRLLPHYCPCQHVHYTLIILLC